MFPPGCARLLTNSDSTGSPTSSITMGIVVVACCAARIAARPDAKMTSTLSRTNSPARPGSRSNLLSAHRHSNPMVCPSIQPSSRSPCQQGDPCCQWGEAGGDPKARTPIRRIFAAGCAVATSGATRMPKASVTIHPTAQSHLVVASCRLPGCLRSSWTLPILACTTLFFALEAA